MPQDTLAVVTNLPEPNEGRHHPDTAPHVMTAELPDDEKVRVEGDGEQPCCVTIDPAEQDAKKATKHDSIPAGAATASATTPPSPVDGASTPSATPSSAVSTSAVATGGPGAMSAVEHLTAAFGYATVTSMLRPFTGPTAPATPATDTATTSAAPTETPGVGSNGTSTKESTVSANDANDRSKENEGIKGLKQGHFVPGLPDDESDEDVPYGGYTGDDNYTDDGYSEDDEYNDDTSQGDSKRGRPKEVDYSGYRKQLWPSGG